MNSKADIDSETRRYQEAVDYSSKAIRIDPTFVKAFKSRGFAYYQLNKYVEACKDLNYYLSTDNNSDNDFDAVKGYIKSMGLTPEK